MRRRWRTVFAALRRCRASNSLSIDSNISPYVSSGSFARGNSRFDSDEPITAQ